MASVKVVSVQSEWDYASAFLRVSYHLSNGETVKTKITREVMESMSGLTLTEVIFRMKEQLEHKVNGKPFLNVDFALKEQKILQMFNEFSTMKQQQQQHLMSGNYQALLKPGLASQMQSQYSVGMAVGAEYISKLFDQAFGNKPISSNIPNLNVGPKVLRLVDLGDGMLVPKQFINEFILGGNTPTSLPYVDDPVIAKDFYTAQYVNEFTEKGPIKLEKNPYQLQQEAIKKILAEKKEPVHVGKKSAEQIIQEKKNKSHPFKQFLPKSKLF